MRISADGTDLLKLCEGLRLTAYLCPARQWTIGYGHTKGVRAGMSITPVQANALLRSDLAAVERDVLTVVKRTPSQGQFDALVSFTFNLGADIDDDDVAEGLGDSTLLKKYNAGDLSGAADEFPRWNKATVDGVKQILPGLVKRRAAERALFLGEDWRAAYARSA